MKPEFSIPNDFQKLIKDLIGNESDSFFATLQTNSPTSVRYNLEKYEPPADWLKIPWTRSGAYLNERPVFTLDPLLHAGCYYVQEASSMFLEQMVNASIHPGERIVALDLCAAPGGKSTHLLSLLSDDSLLVCNEVIRSRVPMLIENIQKWGNANIIVSNNDPSGFQRLTSYFDLIVVDAPCSGEGLFRKDSNAMSEWSLSNVELCSQRQQRILADIWPALKPGGVLIYSTCTYNTLENEKNLEWLLHQNEGESIRVPTDSVWGIEEVKHKGAYAYKFFPHRVKGEGFFACAVRKKGEPNPTGIPRPKRNFSKPSAEELKSLAGWLKPDNNLQMFKFKDQILATPANAIPEIELLTSILNVQVAGTPIATAKHTKLVPEHPFALSKHINKARFHQTPLAYDEAICYLRKESGQVKSEDRGFSLVSYHDHPIGWVNLLGTRFNNLYPQNWRIRMNPGNN